MQNENMYVPKVDDHFVKWGNYELIENVIKSKEFFPMWLYGNAGCGKTSNVEQACANNKREYIRVNFSHETEESDLIGCYKLVDGNQVFEKGPVLLAMERGAVLLCDEVEACRAQTLFCLQSVLEGKHVYVKPLNSYVTPAKGFTVFATGNTKGRGSDDGRFSGLNIMNAAFIDRFAGTVNQKYPPEEIEKDILQRHYVTSVFKDRPVGQSLTEDEKTKSEIFIDTLLKWATQTREAYDNQSSSEVISTRSLINIIKSFSIFKDELTAVKFSCERYDEAEKDALVSMYEALINTDKEPEPTKEDDDDMYVFKSD